VSYLPSTDALDAVTVTSGAASAEWGNYLGGVIATRLRSGTNDWHGSAFGFVRDEALNATNWAAKWQPEDPLNPSRKAPLSHWTAGSTVGGPLARNRVFVFADYQAMRRDQGPMNGLTTVATDAMRAGDFSYLLAGPSPQQLYDPLTTRADPVIPGRFIRDPFPGPQTEASQRMGHPYNRAQVLGLTASGVEMNVREMPQLDGRGEIYSHYRLSPDLQPAARWMSDGYWQVHRQLEARGSLDHAVTDCPERKGMSARIWTGAGWREVWVPTEGAPN
jgi:hypothetical protein